MRIKCRRPMINSTVDQRNFGEDCWVYSNLENMPVGVQMLSPAA